MEEMKIKEKKHLLLVLDGSIDLKKRSGIHNVHVQGESASADTVAAKEYPAELKVPREIDKAVFCYKVMYDEKKKKCSEQTSLLQYFTEK